MSMWTSREEAKEPVFEELYPEFGNSIAAVSRVL
jgi:hypothetical protein